MEEFCPLCAENLPKQIPVQRILEKLDAVLAKGKKEQAAELLRYWCAEADALGDAGGKLTLLNEEIGLFRSLGQEAEALSAAELALGQAKRLGLAGTVTMATTLLNAATAYKAFGRAAEALPLFAQAQEIYEAELPTGDERLGGLYNNMALAMTDAGDFRGAEASFQRAIAAMSAVPEGELEQAVSWCNLASLAEAELGAETAEDRINHCLDRAMALLNTPALPRNGHYAFVCEKCAPTFGYYGRFAEEQELLERLQAIRSL